MRPFVPALLLAALAAGAAAAQPLEQRFPFGAPPGVLGNDRFRAQRTPPVARVRPRGDVSVRMGHRRPAPRPRRVGPD